MISRSSATWAQSLRDFASISLLAVLLASAPHALARADDLKTRHLFNIPAQPLDTALLAFSDQAKIQVFMWAGARPDARSAGASGELTAFAALEAVLANTGLTYRQVDSEMVAIVSPDTSQNASPPGSPSPQPLVRMAQTTTDPRSDSKSSRSAASAQATDSAEPPRLEEIVVTALHREEALQNVAAAVTVLDGAAVWAKGAQDYRDYLSTVPGVNVGETSGGAMRVVIRGISDGLNGGDPLAAIYIDEAPVTESFEGTFDPSIYDIERVEVLKGPQGTLYGAGSMGGTVRIITRKPQLNEFEGSAQATWSNTAYGGNNPRVDGVINLPLVSDHMALRVSAGYRKDAGWIDDVLRGQINGNTIEKKDAHAQLLLEPAPGTSVILGLMYEKEDQGLPPLVDIGLPYYETARRYRASAGSNSRLYSLTLHQDWDWMNLTSASNYLTRGSINTLDASGTLAPLISRLVGVTVGPTEGLGGISGENSINSFTQEVRLASKGKNRVDWALGAFYSNALGTFPTVFDFTQAPSISAVATGARFYQATQEFLTRQIAAFGELTYNITDRLSLTAGARGFNVDQRVTSVGSGILNGGNTQTQRETSKSSAIQKYLLRYQATRDNMLYAQASQGYRNGGPNDLVPIGACGPYLTQLGYSSAPAAYNPDKLWNYEVGTKNTLADGAISLNADVFYIDWDNIQSAVSLRCGFGFRTNSGKAVSKGSEVEAAASPLKGLTLSTGLSYTNAQITQSVAGAPGHDGDPLPLAARWAWNASAQYEHALADSLAGFVRGEVNHVGDRWSFFPSTPTQAALMPAYTTLSARLGVKSARWSVALFGSNLTNQHIIEFASPSSGVPYLYVGRPRVIGINGTVDF